MTRFLLRALVPAILAGLIAVAPARAQMTESELVMRLNRLEGQVRQLTGMVEQLQHRNSQLEQQLARAQPGGAPPAQEQRPPMQPRAAAPQPQYAPPRRKAYPPHAGLPASKPIRRSKAIRSRTPIRPARRPPADGAAMRSIRTRIRMRPACRARSAVPAPSRPRRRSTARTTSRAVGAPGGRQAGCAARSRHHGGGGRERPPPRREVRQIPGALPPPPPRNPSGTGAQQMVMAPTNTPKDEYDLAYGYVLRKDYALAEEALRAFMKKYPNDRLVADANYWLGETLFQRQRYRDAAESFLDVSTKHEKSAKAPDSLLRLGQSLAALKEKEAACATLGEIPRKYPRAPANVKQSAEREQKRVGCL